MKSKQTLMAGLILTLGLIIVTITQQSGVRLMLAGGLENPVYLPQVMQAATIDVTVDSLEINQAIQTASNSVPLVTGRNTMVRVYAESLTGEAVNGVVVRLTATRNGNQIGSVNSAPMIIPVAASRDNPNSSANFLLPGGWLNGNVSLSATVDPNNDFDETDEGNNTLNTTMNFTSVPDLQIRVVPINYTHRGSNAPGFYPAQSVDYVSNWIERAFPIRNADVVVRSPYGFDGDLQGITAWGNLLNEMFLLKLSDGHPENSPIVYYGFVPISNGSQQWFFSGTAGIGYIGYRESVGLNLGNNDNTGTLAGHEVGHNLDRRHAPCGNPAGPDPSYPYPGASIGDYGIDIPTQTFWNASTAVDVMSYCNPSWVSDYTYIGLMNDQLANGAALEQRQQTSLVVTAAIDAAGDVDLLPSYAFNTFPTQQADSSYQIDLLATDGALILSYPLQLREAVEDEVTATMLSAIVPLPTQAVASIRLREGQTILQEKPLRTSEVMRQLGPLTLVEADSQTTLTWPDANFPAIIRYSPDGGQSWQGLSTNQLGGTLTIDSSTLPSGPDPIFEVIPADTAEPATLQAYPSN